MRLLKYFLSFLVLILFINVCKSLLLPGYQDFSYYYKGAYAAFHSIDPYLSGKLYTGYQYPPIGLILFYPFQFLPVFFAGKLWIILSIILLIFSIYLLLKIYRENKLSNVSLLIYSLSFLFFPVRYTLGMGQINLIILFLLSAAFYSFSEKKEKLAGIFFGFTILLKYFPILIILYLIFRKKWTMLLYLFGTAMVLILTGVVIFGPKTNIYFFVNVIPSLIHDTGGSYYFNQSLSGFLSREVPDGNLRNILQPILSLIFIGITFFIMFTKKTDRKVSVFEIGIILTINLLLNSFSWQHHFTWLLIPIFLTFMIIRQKKLSREYYFYLGVIYLLITYNIANPKPVPVIFQSHLFYGGLLLWILDLYILKKVIYKNESNY